MKAVILAAGEGQRLLPLTATRPKPLLPVAGKPVLEHILTALREAKIKEILIIVGHQKEQITKYFGDGSKLNLKITYKEQKEPLGTAHATSIAEDFVGNENFLLIYGDVLTSKQNYPKIIEFFNKESPSTLITTYKVKDASLYGIIKTKNNQVTEIIEKPDPTEAKNQQINAGIYIFTPKIFKAIKQTKKSKRGEYELTDSIQQLIKQDENILAYELEDWWIDIGTPWDLLDANKLLLEETKLEIKGKIEEGAKIIGPVGIGENTIIRSGSYIIGPTLIGKNCDIGPNCFIRPHTYIGNHCRIGNACEIKNSIILNHTHIAHLSYVGDSIIGQNVNFGAGTITANLRLDEKTIKMTIKGKRIDTGRRKLGAIIGDNVKTGIGCMLMPGIKIGQNSLIGPNTTINKDIPPNTITTTKPQNTTKPLQPQPKK